MLLGIFIDIQVVLKYNQTPISLTSTLLFAGALVGIGSALRVVRLRLRNSNPRVSEIPVACSNLFLRSNPCKWQ